MNEVVQDVLLNSVVDIFKEKGYPMIKPIGGLEILAQIMRVDGNAQAGTYNVASIQFECLKLVDNVHIKSQADLLKIQPHLKCSDRIFNCRMDKCCPAAPIKRISHVLTAFNDGKSECMVYLYHNNHWYARLYYHVIITHTAVYVTPGIDIILGQSLKITDYHYAFDVYAGYIEFMRMIYGELKEDLLKFTAYDRIVDVSDMEFSDIELMFTSYSIDENNPSFSCWMGRKMEK